LASRIDDRGAGRRLTAAYRNLGVLECDCHEVSILLHLAVVGHWKIR